MQIFENLAFYCIIALLCQVSALGCRIDLENSYISYKFEETRESHLPGTKLPGEFKIIKAAKEKVHVNVANNEWVDPLATKYIRHDFNADEQKIEFYLENNRTLREYREEQWKPNLEYEFTIDCLKAKTRKTYTYMLGIFDENLYSPTFDAENYEVELRYSTKNGYRLDIIDPTSIQVTDKDFNKNYANVTISCEGEDCKYFDISSNFTSVENGHHYTVHLEVEELKLDELVNDMVPGKSFSVQVIASDGGTQPSSATLHIKVPEDSETPQGEQKSSKLPFILTGSALLVVLFSCTGTVAFLRMRGKKAKDLLRKLTEAEIREFLEGNVSLGGEGKRSVEVNTPIMSLPYNHNFEIQRDKLRIDETTILGTGAFGIVWKGSVVYSNGDSITVAIKTVKRNVGILYFKALLSELKIMAYIGKHPNIVSLVGACTHNIRKREVYIAVQYCANGNFHNYLKCRRDRFSNMVVDGNIQPTNLGAAYSYSNKGCFAKTISTLDLLKWAVQIANGLQYLESLGVIHGDLATRNVLLDDERTAKIADFGLSRRLIDYSNYYYTKTSQAPLPWKWMAPESLKDMRFSKKSDIWSFGIVLWEIFTLGQTPYPGLNWDETFIERLEKGMRPHKPAFASTLLYDIMTDCWNLEAHDRPAVFDIKRILESTINSALRQKGDLAYMKLLGEKKTIFSMMNEDALGYLEPNDPHRKNYINT